MIRSYQEKNSVAHSQLIILSSNVLRLALSLVLTILLGRVLSPADFGFYGLVITLFVIARELMDFGSGSLAVREIALSPDREKSTLETLVGLRVIVGTGLAVACLILALQQNLVYQLWVLMAVALVLPLLSIGTLALVYQLRQNQQPPALIVLTLQFAMLIGCILLYQLRAPAWSYAALLVTREILGLFWLELHAGNTLGYRIRPRFEFSNMHVFLRKAVLVGTAAAMYNLYFYIGPLLIWFLRPAAEMGAYSAAFRPISQLLSFPLLLMLPLLPVLTQFAAKDRPALQQQAAYLVPLAVGMGAVIAVAGLELSGDALFLLYGNKYIQGELSAIDTLRLLSLSFMFSMTTSVVATFLLAASREKELVLLCLAGLLVNLLCNFLLLPVYGFPASALATLATEICVSVFGVILVLRLEILKLSWSILCTLLLPSIVLAFVMQFLPNTTGWPRLAPAFFLSFAAILLLLQLPDAKKGRQKLVRNAVNGPAD